MALSLLKSRADTLSLRRKWPQRNRSRRSIGTPTGVRGRNAGTLRPSDAAVGAPGGIEPLAGCFDDGRSLGCGRCQGRCPKKSGRVLRAVSPAALPRSRRCRSFSSSSSRRTRAWPPRDRGRTIASSEGARRDLPRQAPLVLAPAAGAFLAAVADDRVPQAVGFGLVVGRDLERERLAVLERRPAVQPDAGDAQPR